MRSDATPPPPPLPPSFPPPLTQTQQTSAVEPEGGRGKRGQTIPGGLPVPEAPRLGDAQGCLPAACLLSVCGLCVCLFKQRPRPHHYRYRTVHDYCMK